MPTSKQANFSGPLKFGITDLDGLLRGKMISAEKLAKAQEKGLGFCNVVFGWDSNDQPYEQPIVSGGRTGYSDAYATIDLTTARKIPWQSDLPFYLADFSQSPLAEVCPRSLLKRVLKKAEQLGFAPQCAFEYEWFNFLETPNSLAAKGGLNPQPLTPGMFGYSLLRVGQHDDYFRALWQQLNDFGIPLEGLHTETGNGVYEASIAYSDPLEAADRAALFKYAVKDIAQQHGIMASFMAKWSADLPGCGGHFHQSLRSATKARKAVFYDPKGRFQMSKHFEHYLAGQLRGLPCLMPLYAPTINSYKRLVPGSWAATTASWGVDNRTTALRVINSSAEAMRLETRLPGADANPYLVAAAAIASGIYGIQHQIELEVAPIEGSAYVAANPIPLFTNLQRATEEMKAHSRFSEELFGTTFSEHFLYTREWECKNYDKAVTDWELKRYFEGI